MSSSLGYGASARTVSQVVKIHPPALTLRGYRRYPGNRLAKRRRFIVITFETGERIHTRVPLFILFSLLACWLSRRGSPLNDNSDAGRSRGRYGCWRFTGIWFHRPILVLMTRVIWQLILDFKRSSCGNRPRGLLAIQGEKLGAMLLPS